MTGESDAMSKEMEGIAKAATGEAYDAYVTPDTLQQAVQSVYRNSGYLDARVRKFSKGEAVANGAGWAVPVELEISEGVQYRVAGIRFAHPLLLNEAEFQQKAKLHTGDIANQELLRQSLLLIGLPYRKQGYLHANISATPTTDPAAGKVSYTIDVEPGEVYRFGKLTLADATDTQREEFLKSWKLQTGDAFDATYPPGFLQANAKSLHSWIGYGATYQQIDHLDTHVVDLEVKCRSNPH